ncbi:hypothetical protein ScPMuIL_014309, partial [Solemya velum]
RFIPNFSTIAEPLIKLTRKYARFKWTADCTKAFDYLKDSLTVVPLLVYPNLNKPFVLYTDASDTCIGACLSQETDEGEEQLIYFLSHKLSPKNHCADLLSRSPATHEKSTPESDMEEPDIDDRSFQVNVINSNEFEPKDYAKCSVGPPGEVNKPEIDLSEDIDIKQEQENDEEISEIRKKMRQ